MKWGRVHLCWWRYEGRVIVIVHWGMVLGRVSIVGVTRTDNRTLPARHCVRRWLGGVHYHRRRHVHGVPLIPISFIQIGQCEEHEQDWNERSENCISMDVGGAYLPPRPLCSAPPALVGMLASMSRLSPLKTCS